MLAIKNGVLELQNFNLTCQILAMNIFDRSHITTGGTPLKFVYTGNMTSADRLTFCQPIRNAVCLVKGLIAGSFNCFSHCLLPLPRPLPHHFLFRPLFRFCAAVTLTLRTIKEKTAKNRQLHRVTFFAPCLLVVHLFQKPVLTSETWLGVIKIIM